MGVNLILKKGEETIDLGRAYNYDHKEYITFESSFGNVLLLSKFQSNNISKLFEWKDEIERICEELVLLGKLQLIQELKDDGWEECKE